MTGQERTITCPDCGHGVLRPTQDRCTECGLQWDDWLDREGRRLSLHWRDWLLLLVVFPIIASVLPLLSGRGAITGARTFEASYLLTIPGFAGILYLSWRYARPMVWLFGRRGRTRSGGVVRRPRRAGLVLSFFLLLLMQIVLYLVAIRMGFVYFVEPLRPTPPPPIQAPSASTLQSRFLTQNQVPSPFRSLEPSLNPSFL